MKHQSIEEFNHVFEPIRTYLNSYNPEENELQIQMRTRARKDKKEHWIIPQEVGQFFYILTKMTQAKRIYEVGSYLGYSATWFAKGLCEDGKVYLTEKNDERIEMARRFLEKSEYAQKIKIRHCDAHEDLSSEKETFDIILIDHDKPQYVKAFDIAKKKIKKGGIILGDNVLWRGRIVQSKFKDKDKDNGSTKGIIDFNKHIMNDPEVMSLIVPIGDGISISILK